MATASSSLMPLPRPPGRWSIEALAGDGSFHDEGQHHRLRRGLLYVADTDEGSEGKRVSDQLRHTA